MDDDIVRLGIWYDYSQGKYQGWSLTVENQHAIIVSALIAIRVTATGAHSLVEDIPLSSSPVPTTPYSERRDDSRTGDHLEEFGD